MKRIILTLTALVLAHVASAQINFTDLNPDSSYVIKPLSTYSADSAIWLDIDGDNNDDFYFRYEFFVGIAGIEWRVHMHCIDTANQGYWKGTGTSLGYHYLKQLNYGDSITSNVLFGSDRDPLLGDHVDANIIGVGDKFIGIKFKSGSNFHYGWILLNIAFNSSTNTGTLTVKAYAYNTTPGDGLNAGDTCLVTKSTTMLSDCDSVDWNGTTYKKSGIYTYTTTNSTGCDSIATLVYTNTSSSTLINKVACDSFELNDSVYYQSGAYMQVLAGANVNNCDSTIYLNLTINHPTDTTFTLSGCDSIELNGTTYYTSGNYTQTLTNKAGCDSTINLTIDIDYSSSTTLNITACDSYELNGETYTATGLYIQTLTNKAGCDSTITLFLNLNFSSYTNFVEESCDSFTFNDSTYYTTGIYRDTFTNIKGCDSIVTLDLTVNHPTTNTINATACSDYVLNGITYTQSGTFEQTITNSKGCDSIITLVLTIGSLDKTVTQDHNTLTAQATGVDYQWLNCDDGYSEISGETDAEFTPTANGNYAVEITDGTCTDTSSCYSVTKVGVEYTNFPSSIAAYPNPTGGAVNIDLGTTYTNLTIKVYDALGKLVKEFTLTSASELDLNLEAEAGVYYIHITNDNYSAQLKVLKQ